MVPWAQHISLSWSTSVRYFEHRYRVLEALDDDGLLWGFQISENEVMIRLGDPNHLFSFSPTRMRGGTLQPDGDFGRITATATRVIEELRPRRLLLPTFDFQWVVGIEGSYDELRAISAQRFLPKELGPEDVAAWIDGETSSGRDYLIECGIVEADEIPDRLAREVGRFAVTDPSIEASLWPIEALPPVAFFCDIKMSSGKPIDSIGGFFQEQEETVGEAEELVSALMSTFEVTINE